MLLQLVINNFVIVDALVINFAPKMTAITGETGAGKSIAIDALGLCLGDRAETLMIRHQATRADISACFSLQDTPSAQQWLKENELDDEQECILRRIISNDGRSKGFINGRAVPVSQLKELGQLLIQINGQHVHQQLLRSDQQRKLLDGYINDSDLRSVMKTHYQYWQDAENRLNHYQKQAIERQSRSQLLQYQLKELDEFSPQAGEYERLNEQYKRMANHERILQLSQKSTAILVEHEEYNALSLLNTVKSTLHELTSLDYRFNEQLVLLDEVVIQVSELASDLTHLLSNMEFDPELFYQLEQRISRQISLARKHHVTPEDLPEVYQQLSNEYQQIQQQDDEVLILTEQVKQAYEQALASAKQLHQCRFQHSKVLAENVTQRLRELAMPYSEFMIELNFNKNQMSYQGADEVEFRVTTNLGQPLQPLAKVASGGELARIALAIQVVTAQRAETPALIFDEVDVGISGPTAAKVGLQLRQLGESTQVICVTHSPQVAGSAHHHFFVVKENNDKETKTNMLLLDKDGRLNELARLVGGDKITANTLANAQELLIQ